jgi:HEAT repeats
MAELLAFMSALTLWSLSGQPAAAPAITNGRVVERPVSSDLARTLRDIGAGESGVVWVGYAVPAADRGANACCGDGTGGCCGACRLERTAESFDISRPGPGGPVRLEPAAEMAVFIRLENGRLDRVRTFSTSCPVDAGGRTVQWLTGVRPADSVSWLHARVGTAESRRSVDDALTALAMHGEPAAVDRLIDSARHGATTHTRGQALFWLSQRAGQKAVGAISDVVEKDPDTDVRKRAVFALSQLPDGEGVPKLIDVARRHSNKAVQKQAFFWLGQSKDRRALAFFADVLTK